VVMEKSYLNREKKKEIESFSQDFFVYEAKSTSIFSGSKIDEKQKRDSKIFEKIKRQSSIWRIVNGRISTTAQTIVLFNWHRFRNVGRDSLLLISNKINIIDVVVVVVEDNFKLI